MVSCIGPISVSQIVRHHVSQIRSFWRRAYKARLEWAHTYCSSTLINLASPTGMQCIPRPRHTRPRSSCRCVQTALNGITTLLLMEHLSWRSRAKV